MAKYGVSDQSFWTATGTLKEKGEVKVVGERSTVVMTLLFEQVQIGADGQEQTSLIAVEAMGDRANAANEQMEEGMWYSLRGWMKTRENKGFYNQTFCLSDWFGGP